MHREIDGYVTEVPYNFAYYPEISPAFLRLAANSRALPFPSSGRLRYLELGYGGGISLNVHAAASPGAYWGTDVNPVHVAGAERLAECAHSGLNVLGVTFEELLTFPDLPQFDVIVALGVWSWVSESNRKAIVELLRKCLVDGGLFCLNSLALPKNAGVVPLQRLLRLHAKIGSGTRNSVAALQSGIHLATSLRDAGSAYFDNAAFSEVLEMVGQASPQNVIHEYMQENWRPELLADTAAKLREASLQFVGSMSPLDQYDDLNFPSNGLQTLSKIDDFWLRETAKEFLRPRKIRCDLFVKSNAYVPGVKPAALDRGLSFVLVVPLFHAKSMMTKTPAGEIALNGPAFSEILDLLGSRDYRPKTLGEMIDALAPKDFEERAIFRALMILIDAGIAHPAQATSVAPEKVEACRRLNDEFLRRSLTDDDIVVLASPVTGGGVPVPRIQRIFLWAVRNGANTPNEWAAFVSRAIAIEEATPLAAVRGKAPLEIDLQKEALYFFTCLPVFAALMILPNAPADRATTAG